MDENWLEHVEGSGTGRQGRERCVYCKAQRGGKDCGYEGPADNVRAHIRLKMPDLRFYCNKCWKGFVQRSDLQEHDRAEACTLRYPCPNCGMQFRTEQEAELAHRKQPHTEREAAAAHRRGRAFSCTHRQQKGKRVVESGNKTWSRAKRSSRNRPSSGTTSTERRLRSTTARTGRGGESSTLRQARSRSAASRISSTSQPGDDAMFSDDDPDPDSLFLPE